MIACDETWYHVCMSKFASSPLTKYNVSALDSPVYNENLSIRAITKAPESLGAAIPNKPIDNYKHFTKVAACILALGWPP